MIAAFLYRSIALHGSQGGLEVAVDVCGIMAFIAGKSAGRRRLARKVESQGCYRMAPHGILLAAIPVGLRRLHTLLLDRRIEACAFPSVRLFSKCARAIELQD